MANKPLEAQCARLNSTGHIQKMCFSSFQSDSRFCEWLTSVAYQLRRQIDLIRVNRPKLKLF